MSHSTLQDWEQYTKITEKEYNSLEEKGMSKKEIYKLLRNNRTQSKEIILETPKINVLLETFMNRIRSVEKQSNRETLKLINETIKILEDVSVKLK